MSKPTGKTAPKISVCCAWYNRADFIRDTIDSLLAQDFDSFEIVVVNDGSRDPRVKEILDSYDDPRLRVIHQENTGFVGAIRRAIAETKGEYIAIQGAGDISLPQRLRRQAEILDREPSIGVVSCSSEVEVVGGARHGMRSPPKKRDSPTLQALISEKNNIDHGTTMYRRSLYDKVGGYRHVFQNAQDLDLWIRISNHSKIFIINDLLYRRFVFYGDGVSGLTYKRVSQKIMANLSVSSQGVRNDIGFDFVDIFGNQAIFFSGRRHSIANYCARESLKFVALGDRESARIMAYISRNIAPTMQALAASAAISMCRRSARLEGLIRHLLGRFKNRGSWDIMTPIGQEAKSGDSKVTLESK